MFSCDRCKKIVNNTKPKLIKFDLKVRQLCKSCKDYIDNWLAFNKNINYRNTVKDIPFFNSQQVRAGRKTLKNNLLKYRYRP